MPESFEHADALAWGPQRGRGAGLNPGNRYEAVRLHVLGEHLDEVAAGDDDLGRTVRTQTIDDATRRIINPVDSPDLGFRWTINPYRGCEHGCIYCYARPDHERLGYSCGLDFETKIVVKRNAPQLLRKELAHPKWQPDTIVMSGVTDCYQPLESKLRLTRGCIEVFAECRHPVSIVTKNHLVVRDIDLLQELARVKAVRVALSITTLDARLAGRMEPRASAPRERLDALRRLADAGIPTVVMVSPIIPGLTDREVPTILQAASDAGAQAAGYIVLRLPHQVKALFFEWLERHFPDRAGKVESLIRQVRDGQLYDPAFKTRMRGTGPVAAQIGDMFHLFARRYHLDRGLTPLNTTAFRPPPSPDGQLTLF